jgi:uncharacterized membrane protein YkvI
MAAGSSPLHEKQLLPVWYHAIIAREMASAAAHMADTEKIDHTVDAVVTLDTG